MAWDSLTSLVEESTLLYDTLLYMERYFRFLTLPSDVPKGNQPLLTNNRQEFTIGFKGVDFKYPHADRNVLKNFNLTIKKGDRLALLGENGAGKTTLIKLLTRFYIPDKGKIMLNGQDIQKIQIEDYRKLLTVVFQDPAHYPLTLAENIRLSKLDKENSSFWLKQAVQFAGLTEIVKHSDKGLDQILTNDFEGWRDLSGGQWQAISLARAYYRNSGLMVFDEPSASLDATHEDHFIQSMSHMSQDQTLLLVTHRFSALKLVDRAVYLEGCQVKEDGCLKDLIKDKKHVFHRSSNFKLTNIKLTKFFLT